ncbi:MAG: DNA circularization N-terminal domain-containing protein [Nitrosomonadales bacterium]|nr:DNA circularization N-terminal domain-containing protein [Nitrosomonadales bacterium]
MSWRDRMVTASFRGNQFLTESHDTKGGRRLIVHEYPGAEEPVVEDLGGKAGEFHLTAYFIGPDYDLSRDAFLLALNTPGAEWLYHPWRGPLWVCARDWSVSESNDRGGYCAISVNFVPGGMVQSILVDRTDTAAEKIKGFGVMQDLALEPMSSTSTESMIATVRAQLDRVRNLLSLSSLPLSWISQARILIDGIKGDMAALLATPSDYAAALRSLSDLLGAGDTQASLTSSRLAASGIADTALPLAIDNLVAMSNIPVVMPGGAGDSPALRINLAREADLRNRLLLISAAQLALADYRVAADRDAALASVVGGIDRLLPSMGDAVFQAALDCRAALIDALLAQQLDPASVRDIVSPLPATVLAHRFEMAEDAFIAANRVRHPLFVKGRVYG